MKDKLKVLMKVLILLPVALILELVRYFANLCYYVGCLGDLIDQYVINYEDCPFVELYKAIKR